MPPQFCLKLGEPLLEGFPELVHLHIRLLSVAPGAQILHVGQHGASCKRWRTPLSLVVAKSSALCESLIHLFL